MNYNYLASGEFIKKSKNIDNFNNSQHTNDDIDDMQLFACGKNVCGVFDNENYLCSEPCDGMSWEKIDDKKLAKLKNDEQPNIINAQKIHNIKTNIKKNNVKLPFKQINTNNTNKMKPNNMNPNNRQSNGNMNTNSNMNSNMNSNGNSNMNSNGNSNMNSNSNMNGNRQSNNNMNSNRQSNSNMNGNGQQLLNNNDVDTDNDETCDNPTEIVINTLKKTYEDQIRMIGKIYEERIASIPKIYQQQIDILNKTYQQQITNMSMNGNKANPQFTPFPDQPIVNNTVVIDSQLTELRKAQNEYKDIMNVTLQQKTLQIVNNLIQLGNKQWDNILQLLAQYNTQKQPITMHDNILVKGLEFEALHETLQIAKLRLSSALLSSVNNNINIIANRYKELNANPNIKQIIAKQSQLKGISQPAYNQAYLIPRKNNYKKVLIYDW